MDQAIAVIDFSENFTIQAQDQIERAHWVQRQVTVHPVFVVRHAPTSTTGNPILIKESLAMISDDIKHDSPAVFAFTNQLLVHITQSPGPVHMRVLRRFTEGCLQPSASPQGEACRRCSLSLHGIGSW